MIGSSEIRLAPSVAAMNAFIEPHRQCCSTSESVTFEVEVSVRPTCGRRHSFYPLSFKFFGELTELVRRAVPGCIRPTRFRRPTYFKVGKDVKEGSVVVWSRGTRKGESSTVLCGRSADRTRAYNPRQLRTDHDYAASTCEYQSDQPSRKPPRPRPALPPKSEKKEENSCSQLTGHSISELTRSRPAPARGRSIAPLDLWYALQRDENHLTSRLFERFHDDCLVWAPEIP